MESNFVESVWNQFTQAEEMAPSSLPVEEMTSSSSLAAELEEKMGDLSLENNIQPQITNTNTSYGDTNRNRIHENTPQRQQHHLQFHRQRLQRTQLQRQHGQQCHRHHHRLQGQQCQQFHRQNHPLQGQQCHGYHRAQQHHGPILRLWGPQYPLQERHGRFNFQGLHHHHHLHRHPRRYHGHHHPQSQLQVPSHVSMGTCPLPSLGFTNQNETNRNRALAMSHHNRQQLLQQRRSMATCNSGILRSIGNDFENTQDSDDQETLLHNADKDLNSDIIRIVANMLIANDCKNIQESDHQENPLHNDDMDDDIDVHDDDIGVYP